jgi:beta-lactamase regulating signal transducer with metallopeptidase domain/cell division septation protein DedD
MTTMILNRIILSSGILAFMTAIALILIKLLRIKSPRMQALIWLLIMLKPIFVLVFGSPFSIPVNIPERFSVHFQRQAASSQSPADNVQPKNPAQHNSPSYHIPFSSRSGFNPPRVDSGVKTFPSIKEGSSYTPDISITDWIIFSWGLGVGIFLVLFIRSRILLNRLIVKSRPFLSCRLGRILPDICREMNIKKIPELCVSRDIGSPALAGFFFPRILIPGWLDHDDCGPELRWILRHELMHLKMRDPLALLTRRIFTSIFFFHPLAWFAASRWLEAAEKACDRALVQNEDDAFFYVKTLYRIIEYIKENKKVCRADGLFATRSRIGKRIRAILEENPKIPIRLSAWQTVPILGICLAILFFNPGFIQRQSIALEEKSIVANPSLNQDDEKHIPESPEVSPEKNEEFPVVSFKGFSGAEGSRPEGWEIFGAPKDDFWYIKDGAFYSGNGDDLINNNSTWSYAIYKDARVELPVQNLRVVFSMLQMNGNLALIAGWKDENNHIRGVLGALKGKRSLIIEQVRDGEATVLAELVTGEDNVLEQFEIKGKETVRRTLELGISGDNITLIYNDKKRIAAKVNLDDLRGGFWGLGIWFNLVKFHAFDLFEPEPAISEGENFPPLNDSPFNITVTFPYRIIIARDIPPAQADRLINKMKEDGYAPIQKEETGKDTFTVLLGAFLSKEEAKSAVNVLMSDGFIYKDIIRSSSDQDLPCFRICVGKTLKEDESGEMQKRLKEKGYSPIVSKSSKDGQEILVGKFNAESEALDASKSLEKDGFSEIGIVKDPQFYTVLIREWGDRKWAELLKESLQKEGYYPISIHESDSSFKVTMGDFPERKDAEDLANLLRTEGYSATVMIQP